MKKKYGIHWFRRDLRIAGNDNLRHNWKFCDRNVLGIFFFDAKFLNRSDFSNNRFAFFIKTLRELKLELRAQGGDLLVVGEQAQVAFPKIFDYLKKNKIELPELISYGLDYEPYALRRDSEVKKIVESYGVKTYSTRDHVIIEPTEILKDDKIFYQMYSPFYRKWYEKLASTEIKNRLKTQNKIGAYYRKLINHDLEKIFKMHWSEFRNFPFQDQLEFYEKENEKSVTIKIPQAGFKVAYERLIEFKDKIAGYEERRNIPAVDATSQMSIYQKNGSFVSSQIVSTLKLTDSTSQYLKEIAWREFYYAIMFHKPQSENSAFLVQYENLQWENNQQWFQRWCEGKTGFPIVDAGMRQLNSTGWMHNRVRMIVASFLTKDLLIDWRWGENYFMKMLLDGDLAPNNGGWQWAASTGCDAQPYFRIFNPWLQATKFDAGCEYIKTYVPELKKLSAKQIHTPDADRGPFYPKPMVNHALQKHKSLSLFQNLSKK